MNTHLRLVRILFLCVLISGAFRGVSQEWTWTKGPNTINAAGNYGTMGLSAASNLPGAREAGATWTDNSGNLWLFGGNGYGAAGVGRLNDLWKWNTSTSEWTWVKGSNVPGQWAVYGTKGTANVANTPGARSHAVTWTDNSGYLWLFGGYGYDAAGNVNDLNDLWRYNTLTNEWTWMSGTNLTLQYGVYGTQGVASTTNCPGARRHHISWKDNSGNLWLYGGYGLGASTGESTLNDLWRYNVGSNQWTWMKGSNNVDQAGVYGTLGTAGVLNTPGARYGSATWTDNSGNLYLYGGYGTASVSVGYLNDVWKFNTSTSQWTWLKGSALINQTAVPGMSTIFAVNNNPGGKSFSVGWSDNSGNGYIHGGYGYCMWGPQQQNDMWKYDISLNQWTFVRGSAYYEVVGNYGTLGTTASSNDPGSGNLRMGWKDNNNNFWLFGGNAYDVNANFSVMSDLWKMNYCVAPAPVQVSPYSSNNICTGGQTTLTAVSGTNPVTWYSSATGTAVLATGSVYVTPVLSSPTTATSYTYYASSTNTCGASAVRGQIIATAYSVYPVVTTGTTYTQSMNIGYLQTINSNWSPAVYNFTDPLPVGAIITGIDLTYDGKDQGGGGTGAPADLYVTDVRVASTPLWHTWNPYSTTFTGPISTYVYGGANTFKFYFWGYPAWQGFLNNIVLTFRYQTKTPPPITACQNSSLTLKGYGAVSYTWSGGAVDGMPSPLTSTQIYTVTGANAYGCTNSATIQVNATPAPTVAISGGTAICAGAILTQTAGISGTSHTFSWSTGATTNSIIVTPTISTLYSATASNTLTGCSHTLLRKVTVNSIPTISASVSSGTICAGLTSSLAVTTNGSAGALNFDGVDDYVETNISITELGQGDFTIEAWIKTTGYSEAIVTCLDANTSWDQGEKAFYLDGLGVPTFVGFGNSYIIGNVSVNDGQWHHVAVVWDYTSGTSGTGYIYVDGVDRTSSTTYAANNNNVGTFKIGKQNYNNYTPEAPNNFSGLIDDVRIWNTARTISMISSNMNSCLTGNESGLKAYYKFEDGSGSLKLADQSNSDYHGVLTNMNASTAWVDGKSNCFSGFTYFWTPGSFTTQSITVIPGSTTGYTVSATNGFLCTGSTSRTITVNPLPVVSVNSGSICFGNSFTITPSGASTYSFLTGAAVVSPTVNSSYSITGTSSLGCVSNPVVSSVSVNALPTITVNSGGICPGSVFTMSPSGAMTYTYSNGSSTVSPGSASSYSVTGTDANGCVSSNAAVANVTIHPVPVISVNSGTVCSSYPFTLVPSGAVSYSFSSGSAIVAPLITTSYSVTGTNSLGCVSPVPGISNITAFPLPTITVNSGTICLGKTFTITPGGAASYVFVSGASTVAPVSNASYSVTGSSSVGCAASNTAVAGVTVNPLPPVSITGTTDVCYGSALTLTANGASTYLWDTGPTTNTVLLSPSSSTTYTLTGTDAVTGCSNTATRMITVNPLPVLSVNSGTICAGYVFTMNPSGAAIYVYSSGSNTVNPLITTSYSITGTDALGCVSASPAVSNVTAYPIPTITANSGTICAGDSFTITPAGASTYTFLNGASVVSPAGSTSYSITGSSAFGCPSAGPAVANVTVNPLPVVSISGTNAVCYGSALTLTANGASTYAWDTGPTTQTISLIPSASTTYTLTGTNAATGCTNTATRFITVNPLPIVSVNSGTICAGYVFTMNPSGAATYIYSSGTSTVNPLTTTSYSVTGTDALGCVSANPAISNVTAYPIPTITANSGTICAGNSFTITPAGANTYTFLNGSFVVSPTTSTSYSIIGSSSFGCPSAAPFMANITVNPLPPLNISGPNAVCSGSAIIQTVSGADTYSWSTGSTNTNITISPTVATLYSVTGTITLTGCVNTISKLINIGTPPVITVNSGNICQGTPFTMVPSGAATYTFSNGSGTVLPTVSPTANTSYFVSGTSAAGCVSTNSAISNVIVNAAPVIVVNSGGICAGSVFTMVPTGASTYTFLNGSSTVAPLANQSYSVTGTNVLGCVSLSPAIANVTVHPLPSVTAPNGSVCLGNNYSITPSGAASYTYMSLSGPVSPWIAPTANTNYSITGTSAQGCVSSAPLVITVSVIALPVISVNSGTVCTGSIFTLNPSGASTYTYSSGSPTVVPLSNTSYTVTGTSSVGCISSVPAVAQVTPVAIPVVSVSSGVICAGEVYTIIPTGASTYSYSGNSATVAPMTNTSYTVTGTNTQGCTSNNLAVCNLVVNPSPTLAVLGNQVLCAGESTTLFATGANSYTWNGSQQGSTQSFSPAASGIYTVSGTNSNLCTGSKTIVVTVNSLPVLGLNTGTVCPNSTFTIVPSGAMTYTYSGGSNTVAPAVTTNYTVSGTDANGCKSLPAVTTVTVINAISISVSGTTLVCAGDPATLAVSGAATYTWSTGEFTSAIVTSPSVSSTFSVIGANGTCADTAFISVQVNALPSVLVNSTSTLICVGESATLTSSGANSYLWGGGETSSTLVISPSVATVYTVTGTGANGCSAKVMITQNVSQCLGIDPVANISLIKLYPNPNTGEFVIETPVEMKIVVKNTLGQQIAEKQLMEGKNRIILDEQAKGIYFVEFKNERQAKTIKVIKQ